MNSDDVGVFDVGGADDRLSVVDDNEHFACLYAAVNYEELKRWTVVSEQVKRRRRLRLWLFAVSLALLPILVWLAWWMGENL